MKKDKIKKRKLYKRGGRITYYNMGGMYGNNTVPASMINPGPQASYEQVNQAQINAGQNQLAQIQANPWQQQFQEQQAQSPWQTALGTITGLGGLYGQIFRKPTQIILGQNS